MSTHRTMSAALVAAVAVAGFTVVGLTAAGFTAGGRARGHPDAGAVVQALAVDRLLVAGAGSRVRLASAVDLVTRCVRLDAAVADLAATGTERLAQRRLLEFLDLSRLEQPGAALPGAALPGAALPDDPRGGRREELRGGLRDLLREALLRSADTDAAFLGWARARQANGCAGDGFVGVSDEAFARARRVESTYRAAMRAGDTSTAAKRAFLDRWNPVATRLGLRVWTEFDI